MKKMMVMMTTMMMTTTTTMMMMMIMMIWREKLDLIGGTALIESTEDYGLDLKIGDET